MPECKIDHTAEGAMPEAYCRKCHPELNRTPEQIAEAVRIERERLNWQSQYDRLTRELDNTKRKLENITRRGEPDEDSVSGKIAKSLRKKIDRLGADIANHLGG